MAEKSSFHFTSDFDFKFWVGVYFFVFLVSLIVLVSSFYFYLDDVFEVKIIDSSFSVVERVGYNPVKLDGHFGKITLGNSTTKLISVKNKYDFSVKVLSYARGDLEGLVYGDTGKIIEPNGEKDFSFTLTIPDNYEFGDYKGEIILKFKKA